MKYFLIQYFLLISILFSSSKYYNKISEYNIFKGDPHNLETYSKHTPYDLINSLFTDYALKFRTIYIPENKKIEYLSDDSFVFPIGTIISKTFYYPNDFQNLEKGISLKETRILIHEANGWIGLPYIWDENESDAYLKIAGGIKNITWYDSKGELKKINYIIPNMNQCKGCHMNSNNSFLPIGPKARNINSLYNYGNEIENQIIKWNKLGYFSEVPDIEDIPKVAKWDDPLTGNINSRARAWLDINCAHCHNYNGPANSTGLYLDLSQTDLKKIGFNKTPVAAGRGSGNLNYDIVPGNADESILIYRYNSTDPGIMMPELGRTLVHEEGLILLKEWINSFEAN